MSVRIKDFKIKNPRMAYYPRDIRFMALDGDGTYAVNQGRLLPKIGKELGANKFICYTLCTDNNHQAVSKALAEANSYSDHKPMILWHNHHRFFLNYLPSLDDTVGGFGRSPETCVESAPRFISTIIQGVGNATLHDYKCGGKTSFIIEPFNFGSHIPAKFLQDLESRIQGLKRGTRVGLTTIPNEMMALSVFRNWFPMLLANEMFGVNATVISDETLGRSSTSRRAKDEMILKGIVATGMAFLYDSSLPGYRDIWKILSAQSKLIGVSAIESDIIAWRRLRTLWRVGIDQEVSVIQIRRLIKRLLADPNLRLIDAEVDEASPKVLIVIARVERWVFDQAVEESFVPDNVITLFVPTNSFKITAVLFFPLIRRIFSIEKRFGLQRYNPTEPYLLPDTITETSIRHTKPILEKTSTVAKVSLEVLLNGKYN
jgi:hypothetical protein